MNILDYFDHTNPIHLAAWRVLNNTGSWPEWFIKDWGVTEFPNAWQIIVASRMAEEYCKNILIDDFPLT